jgi:uncharacterized protein (DUF362 family)
LGGAGVTGKEGKREKNGDRGEIYVRYGADGREGALEILRASNIADANVANAIRPGMSVGLKPNLVVSKPSSSGATTSPLVVAGVVEFLLDSGVRDITVMEGSWVGDSTKRAWRNCGYEDLAKRYGVKLLDLKDDETVTVTEEGFSFEVCVSPRRVDFLVNMPVLKGHCQTLMTCALKNLKGCLPDREKRRFHQTGLHRPIALLNLALKPGLILVDALCGDPTFEEGGNPVEMNRLLLGRDPVKIDAYGASLLGISPARVEHLVLAEKLGVGSSLIGAGDVISIGRDSSRDLSRAGAGKLPRAAQRFAALIDERAACSACYASLIHALCRLRPVEKGAMGKGAFSGADKIEKKIEKKIKIGQGWRGQTGDGLGVGDCASGCAQNVPGCPPRAEEILRFLTRIL